MVDAVRAEVDKAIAEELKGKPLVAQLLQQLKPQFEASLQKSAGDLASLFRPDLAIPKGTPLNLLLNLRSDKFPYALGAYLTHQGDPRGLAEALLQLSECPDLVENHGHTFGSDLRPRKNATSSSISRPSDDRRRNRRMPSENEFDYIVVGSGAGGGPVAANLAAPGSRSS